MDFYKTFHVITYLLVIVGLSASLLTKAISLLILIGGGILATAALLLRLKSHKTTIPGPLKTLLSLAAFLFLIIDLLFISPSLLIASIRFLFIIETLKFFDLNSDKDYLQLYSIIFFQLISASASTTSLIFLPIFIIFIVILIWAMILFHLKREGENNPVFKVSGTEPLHKIEKGLISPRFLLATAVISFFSFILTLLLFFTIPRLEMGAVKKGIFKGIPLPGLAEEVNLGDIGRVKLDPTVVMRIELPDLDTPPNALLYWRGKAFDHFNGFRWTQTETRKKLLRRGPDGTFMADLSYISGSVSYSGHTEDSRRALRQKIALEPLVTELIFAASYGTAVSGDIPLVKIDNMGGFYLTRPFFKRIEYTAYSYLPFGEAFQDKKKITTLISTEAPHVSEKYLQIPEAGDRLKKLAKSITSGLNTPQDKAQAVEDYLKRNYRYNLEAPWKGEGNPLEVFLFDVKEGFCEQFATAMAILLRHVGVDTRLVTGFLHGEWNRYGNYFLVRQKNAHSWVEVYLPSIGWATFDPTPPVEIGEVFIISPLTMYLDFLRHKWNRYIIHYSFKDQISMVRSIENKAGFLQKGLKELYRDLWISLKGFKWRSLIVTVGLLGFLSLIIISSLLFFWRNRGLRRAIKKWGKGRKGIDFYLKMLNVLERKGIKKGKSVTPNEFVNNILSIYGRDLYCVRELTDLYNEVRFGGKKMDRKKEIKVREILTTLST